MSKENFEDAIDTLVMILLVTVVSGVIILCYML